MALTAIAVSLVALPACSGTATHKTKASKTTRADRDSLTVIGARTVLQDPPTGIQGQPQVLGYVEVKQSSQGDQFHFVFDDKYRKRLGYYTENGATYRYDYYGKESLIGNYVPEKSLLVLYGAGAGQIRLVRE